MNIYDTSCVFGLMKSTDGYKPWQFPKVKVNLPEDFFRDLKFFETFTKRAKPTETRLRYKLDLLINAVCRSLSA
ncbi:hypothetical protein N7447_000623 [Penicillium robsamsonii]|uniref:uncharacterized protein n=1 Tax=Penicillium robsamsonii TaxID=1792511 RepID=UPI00254995BA|nr:uncharacterized protein N7447_000623 [Penicillium robsamsonii]KAJ5834597.1 hypothetical protein N7447_000623 [Penicillium robsamsonii]